MSYSDHEPTDIRFHADMTNIFVGPSDLTVGDRTAAMIFDALGIEFDPAHETNGKDSAMSMRRRTTRAIAQRPVDEIHDLLERLLEMVVWIIDEGFDGKYFGVSWHKTRRDLWLD